nr:MAG TPA: hypothetical protein [Bacteriophage sp.]
MSQFDNEATMKKMGTEKSNESMERIKRSFMELERIDLERNVMSESEFEPFVPLYQNHDDIDTNPKKARTLIALSQQLRDKVNIYKPIVIVQDYNREEIITVLPPIENQVKMYGTDVARSLGDFSKEITSDRPDIAYSAQAKLALSIMNAQKFNVETVVALKDKTLIKSIQALQKLNPKHPIVEALVKKEREASLHASKESQKQNEQSQIDFSFEEEEGDVI